MRKGSDLIYVHSLPLKEALSCSQVKVKKLDGGYLLVNVGGLYVTPQTELLMEGEGMPEAGTNDYMMDTQLSLIPVK